jgi:hypothetical protein
VLGQLSPAFQSDKLRLTLSESYNEAPQHRLGPCQSELLAIVKFYSSISDLAWLIFLRNQNRSLKLLILHPITIVLLFHTGYSNKGRSNMS